ncbi:hypothetical protein SAMN05443253_101374 [Bacillus sp. OK048]|nr:hypothetical protein SAMN05443253_101374 [Bacillus sp. OK048]
MGTRVSYPVEVKMKAIKMRLTKVLVKEVMEELNIRNKTQLKTWMRWYRNGEIHRLHQPVGKQYTFGKGPEFDSETAKLQAENRYLKQQIEVLKMYAELERKWRQK